MSENKGRPAQESDLVARAKRGDKGAFSELAKLYLKPVYYLAYRFVRDHDTADELAQECFVKAYQALDSFIEGKSFKSWIFAIVSNLSINYLKRKKRESSLDETLPNDILEDKKVGSNPHDSLIAGNLESEIGRAVEELPEDFKAVFILRTYEDMSYEEIAKTLKIESGTVMSRLFRARKILREKLKEYLK